MKTYTDYEIIKAAVDYASNDGQGFPTIIVREAIQNITGWTIWTGGECPVGDTQVEVMFHDGEVATVKDSQSLYWGREEKPNEIDIIAYRIIEPDISDYRGWCEVTEKDGDIAVMYAQEGGLSNYKNAATVTIKWEHVKTSGLKVRKLTVEDISDE